MPCHAMPPVHKYMQDNVVSVATNYDRSRLLVTVLIAAVGLVTILSTIGLILVIRKRSRKKETVEDNVEDKEEPVKEYKVGVMSC